MYIGCILVPFAIIVRCVSVSVDGWMVGMKITGHSKVNGAVSVCPFVVAFFFLFFEWLSPIETNTHTQESFCIHSINQPIPSPPRHTFKVMESCMDVEQSLLAPQLYNETRIGRHHASQQGTFVRFHNHRTDSNLLPVRRNFSRTTPCLSWLLEEGSHRSNKLAALAMDIVELGSCYRVCQWHKFNLQLYLT